MVTNRVELLFMDHRGLARSRDCSRIQVATAIDQSTCGSSRYSVRLGVGSYSDTVGHDSRLGSPALRIEIALISFDDRGAAGAFRKWPRTAESLRSCPWPCSSRQTAYWATTRCSELGLARLHRWFPSTFSLSVVSVNLNQGCP